MDHSEDFENGKLFPMIVRYSVPAAISLLITAIYNIVDRIFVGNYCGTSALAGLSVCFPLSFLMMAVGLNCSAGGATLFSLFRGRGEKKDMSRSFGNSYLMVVVLELLLSAILLLFAEPVTPMHWLITGSLRWAVCFREFPRCAATSSECPENRCWECV